MKKFGGLLLLCVSLVLGSCSLFRSDHVVGKHGSLSVKDQRLVDKYQEPIVLKGVSISWHNWWPHFYKAENVDVLAKDWNCTLVRAAIGVEPEGGYLSDPEKALACLDEIVQGAIRNGIYVIIDWHSHKIHTAEAQGFFQRIVTQYKGVPNVIYEIYNEPDNTVAWKDIKDYSQAVIQTIRSIDEDALILVPTPFWDQHLDVAAQDPLPETHNIMYTLHFYAGEHKDEHRNRARVARQMGLPIFVSECGGMNPDGNGPLNFTEWDKWHTWMRSEGLSWTAWGISDKEETCSMIKPDPLRKGQISKDQLSRWGVIVQEEINKPIP